MNPQHRRRATLGTALVATVLLATTACSSGDPDDAGGSIATDHSTVTAESAPVAPAATASPTTAPADDSVGATPAPTTAAVVPEALQFTAPLVGGGEFQGADVADRPTVFWFWAPT